MSGGTFQPIAGAADLADAQARDYDRRWLVVSESGVWLDAAQAPRLAQLKLSLMFGYLAIKAPGMLRLDIPMDVIEDDDSVDRSVQLGDQAVRTVDEGDLAAAWFTEWLGQPCRLMKVHPEAASFSWPD